MKMRSAGERAMWSHERLKSGQWQRRHAGRCADHLGAGGPEALVAFLPDLGVCRAIDCLSTAAMSERFEQYKLQAVEWERLAAETKSPLIRECYQSLAQQWWELARQADQFEGQRGQD
jgi:hypothetical protein